MYLEIVDIVRGVPITSSYGFLGWSSITMVHDVESNDYILLDCGGFNNRLLLIKKLKELGIDLGKVTKIAITHLHFDHCMNLDLFPKATIYIAKKELNYALSNEPIEKGDMFIPVPYIENIIKNRDIVEISDGYKVHRGLVAIELPGHTPGSIGYLDEDKKVLFVGDSIKNLHELMINEPALCFGTRDNWLRSLNKVLSIAEIIIPGHDSRIKIDKNLKKYRRIGSDVAIEFEIVINSMKKRYKLDTRGELVIDLR